MTSSRSTTVWASAGPRTPAATKNIVQRQKRSIFNDKEVMSETVA
jgi:hypothetical protein